MCAAGFKLVAQSNLFLQTRFEISPFSYLMIKVKIIQLLRYNFRQRRKASVLPPPYQFSPKWLYQRSHAQNSIYPTNSEVMLEKPVKLYYVIQYLR